MKLPTLWRAEEHPLMQRFFSDGFDKLVEDFFGRSGRFPRPGNGGALAFVPDLDVVERDGEFVVKAELPGLSIGDIDVSMVGDALQIKGEKKEEKKEEKDGYFVSERSYGSFLRRIPLSSAVDASKIAAKLEKGVLEVKLPKCEPVKPTKIEVKGESAPAT